MKSKAVKLLKEYNIIFFLIIVAVACWFGVPFFNKPNNLYNLLADISMYGILAVGMTFLLISGEVDLSIGMSVALSTITCAAVSSRFGGGVGVLATMAVGVMVSVIVGVLTTKLRMSSLIASIAIMTTLEGLAYLIGNGRSVALTDEFIRSLYRVQLFGVQALSLPVLLFIAVLILGGILLRKTRFGRSVLVAGGNAEAGYMAGLDMGNTKFLCFIICGVTAGITAILLTSYVYCGAVTYGSSLNLTTISACVLGGTKFTGGKGGILRTLMGICVMRIIVNVTSLLSLSAWAQNTITGVLLILVMVLDRYSRVQREEDAV